MTGMMPLDWFSICLIGAPASRMFESRSATPPPRLDNCSEELMPREIDSMLSSMRSRKHDTSSPRWALPALRKVGVAGWKRPERISSTISVASFSSRSEEHTSELQPLMRISYAVFFLKKKKKKLHLKIKST